LESYTITLDKGKGIRNEGPGICRTFSYYLNEEFTVNTQAETKIQKYRHCSTKYTSKDEEIEIHTHTRKKKKSWTRWCMPLIPALRRQRKAYF
jgi:hypothetical protein